ncbi:MAG: M20 family peptidase, partial [Anaerolineaceae bacterium]|nr:M20 family peptidase [Anaerolineaceae bacterium]
MNIFIPILLSILVLGLVVVLWKTLTFAKAIKPIPAEEHITVDTSQSAEHLSRTIRIETVSFKADQPPSSETLLALHQLLEEMYPLAHKHLKREKINEFSLLYTWQGTQPELPGVLFMAHQDVVPVDPATLDAWTHPPFSGQITEDSVWGRGTLDIKSQITCTLDAVEELLTAGFQPERTIYLGYGHDEEIGGIQGASRISDDMAEKGIRLDAVVDEGGMVAEGMLPGVSTPLALIGRAEKGYLTLEISVEAEPGHSSTPPQHTAIGILSQAITRLENNPLPARLDTIENIFRSAGKKAPFLYRMVFANLWLTRGIVERMLTAKGETNAVIRTTTAVTMISGGIKDNILPREARAKVNFRLMSGETSEGTIAAVRKIINDERVQIQAVKNNGWEPSPVSRVDSPAYHTLEKTIRQFFENAAISPYLVLGATDARYYYNVCENVYRFMPIQMDSSALKLIHGIDEHISITGLEK